ncbi:MAG: pyridine nucleotide-disulfide oxidoreductase [Anaerosolibacter sp.]|jgi:thioredoxin reductase|uniref:NAD(P)/FAD-dependent oxidoreductase n=1 Tax=Anaerosolibacter sp. TaxID=1872527 RepID=UPI002610B5DD|nr:FAD-dependent oxidoreductase [Anaerosolibacter sp.]MDF2548481.1 pyridine nucleotide-disulfide oxidoreductase [Anaerosolibacter sp.]
MNSFPIVVIGAGPAGLSAAIEAAKAGAKVLVIDENLKPGGQLFKQIHKFFGSRVHKAGVRGMDIGRQLLEETKNLGIEVWLDTEVCGIDQTKNIWAIRNKDTSVNIRAEKVIVASGATENAVRFPGWTLPGVMGAGAAQTMINTNHVLPGKKILMVGSGNVGVIVSYQLLQAGAEVVGIIEAAPQLGGYGVHTAKVRRAGVPFYTAHTIKRAMGDHCVAGAEIVGLDAGWNPIPGTEKVLKIDTICLATGLTPLTELAWIAGCEFTYIPELGGHVPIHDLHMESTVKGIYIAGDISGVEEASTAMEEGRLAGISAAADLGCYTAEEKRKRTLEIWDHLNALRCGQFGQKRRDAKDRILAVGKEMISWAVHV